MADSKNDATTQLKRARDFKEQGNKFYQNGEYEKAIAEYQKIFDNLEEGYMVGENEAEQKDLVQVGRLNIAQCYKKLKEWEKAKSMCEKILETNHNVTKAWYCLGESSMKMDELKHALDAFSNVMRLEPNNIAVTTSSVST